MDRAVEWIRDLNEGEERAQSGYLSEYSSRIRGRGQNGLCE